MKLYFIIIAILVLCFTACEEEIVNNLTSIEVSVTNPGLETAKTLSPDTQLMKTARYTLSGNGPDGALVGKMDSITGQFTVSNIPCGVWNFEAAAVNSVGVEIAKGSKSMEITQGTGSLVISMNELPGIGRLEISFVIEGELYLPPTSNAELIIELYDQKNDSRTVFSRNLNRNSLTSAFSRESLHAGSYEISAILYKDNNIVTSAIEAVRIIGGTTTTGRINLLVSSTTEVANVLIQNDVSAPILGTIKAMKKGTGNEFKSYLLIYKPLTLPAGLTEEDLTYRWYCGGTPIKNGNSRSCEVSPAKDSQYTVLVASRVQGSTGSCRITVNGLDNSHTPGGATQEQM